MITSETTHQPRLLTPAELGVCIRAFREARQWSQEQLAEISRLNVRTIQRVENGEAASFDTRRALADAFGFEDIDTLNKPFHIPTTEEIKAAKETFDREHVTLPALPLTTGRQLGKLSESFMMDLSEPAFELTNKAAKDFAALVDYFRDYRDCADLYSESEKLKIYEELQEYIDALLAQSVSLRYAVQNLQVKWGSTQDQPVQATALYVIAFPLGKEPQHIAVPRDGRIGL